MAGKRGKPKLPHSRKRKLPPGQFEGEKLVAHELRMTVERARLDAEDLGQVGLVWCLRYALASLDAFRDGNEEMLVRLHDAVTGIAPKPRPEHRRRMIAERLAGYIVEGATSIQRSSQLTPEPGPLQALLFSATMFIEWRLATELAVSVRADEGAAQQFGVSVMTSIRSLLLDRPSGRGRPAKGRRRGSLHPPGMALNAFRAAVTSLVGSRLSVEGARLAFGKAYDHFDRRGVDRLRKLDRPERRMLEIATRIAATEKQTSP